MMSCTTSTDYYLISFVSSNRFDFYLLCAYTFFLRMSIFAAEDERSFSRNLNLKTVLNVLESFFSAEKVRLETELFFSVSFKKMSLNHLN